MEAEEAQDKLNAVQNSIFSANEEMDRFKLQMNWNQEELEQWALAAKQKEEDNLALQKYARADDVKIKELRYARLAGLPLIRDQGLPLNSKNRSNFPAQFTGFCFVVCD